MMAAFGRIDEFKTDSDDWLQYTERLQQYFIANDIDDEDKQRAILLSVCGAQTYALIRSLVSPAKPSEKSFQDLCDIVQNHHHPKPSPIVQRVKFASLFRQPSQSISSFMAACRSIDDCEFGASLNEMLRDRLVIGVRDDRIQRRLMSEPDLQFARCLEIAQSMEVAANNTTQMNSMNSLPHCVSDTNTGARSKEGKINKVNKHANHSNKQKKRYGGQHSRNTTQENRDLDPVMTVSHASQPCRKISKPNYSEEFVTLKKKKMQTSNLYKTEMLSLERRKTEALERIAQNLEVIQARLPLEPQPFSLSPVISFTNSL